MNHMPITKTPFGPVHWTEKYLDRFAPAVVLLHGLGGDSSFWSTEQESLSRNFRAIAIELRGSGATPSGPELLSIETMARDVISVLDDAGISSAHIVGYSMGGLVAQSIAASYPERVRSLVLAATYSKINIQSRIFLTSVGACYKSSITEKQMFDLVLPWLFSKEFLESDRAAPYLSFPEESPGTQSPDDWIRSLNATLSFDGRQKTSEIKARTLIMCGTNDNLAPLSDSEELKHGIANSTLCMIHGGHLFNIESPDDFNDSLQKFLISAHEMSA